MLPPPITPIRVMPWTIRTGAARRRSTAGRRRPCRPGLPARGGRKHAPGRSGMMPRMANGDSRSIYVVQRTFSRVRRGYDPAEVDRHLQLVSEWFVGSRMGELAREIEGRLEARERTVAEREQQVRRLLDGAAVEADATLEGARLKAAADLRAAER